MPFCLIGIDRLIAYFQFEISCLSTWNEAWTEIGSQALKNREKELHYKLFFYMVALLQTATVYWWQFPNIIQKAFGSVYISFFIKQSAFDLFTVKSLKDNMPSFLYLLSL